MRIWNLEAQIREDKLCGFAENTQAGGSPLLPLNTWKWLNIWREGLFFLTFSLVGWHQNMDNKL